MGSDILSWFKRELGKYVNKGVDNVKKNGISVNESKDLKKTKHKMSSYIKLR